MTTSLALEIALGRTYSRLDHLASYPLIGVPFGVVKLALATLQTISAIAIGILAGCLAPCLSHAKRLAGYCFTVLALDGLKGMGCSFVQIHHSFLFHNDPKKYYQSLATLKAIATEEKVDQFVIENSDASKKQFSALLQYAYEKLQYTSKSNLEFYQEALKFILNENFINSHSENDKTLIRSFAVAICLAEMGKLSLGQFYETRIDRITSSFKNSSLFQQTQTILRGLLIDQIPGNAREKFAVLLCALLAQANDEYANTYSFPSWLDHDSIYDLCQTLLVKNSHNYILLNYLNAVRLACKQEHEKVIMLLAKLFQELNGVEIPVECEQYVTLLLELFNASIEERMTQFETQLADPSKHREITQQLEALYSQLLMFENTTFWNTLSLPVYVYSQVQNAQNKPHEAYLSLLYAMSIRFKFIKELPKANTIEEAIRSFTKTCYASTSDYLVKLSAEQLAKQIDDKNDLELMASQIGVLGEFLLPLIQEHPEEQSKAEKCFEIALKLLPKQHPVYLTLRYNYVIFLNITERKDAAFAEIDSVLAERNCFGQDAQTMLQHFEELKASIKSQAE